MSQANAAPMARRSGILLHPTSLPGPYGAGDLGAAAYHFVDWLVAAQQTLWQMLPLGGVGPGNSPYMSPSAFAGNELLIDLPILQQAGWLTEIDIMPLSAFRAERVNYALTRSFRLSRLQLAAQRFFASAPEKQTAYTRFCADQQSWLDDYALFMALDKKHGAEGGWQNWPVPLARRTPNALKTARNELHTECNFWKFCQWCFDTQWRALKHYANDRGIALIGDVPIFVAPHSADVWANQSLFDLNKDGTLRVVAGVPPDYFSATGQHWGNPLYLWGAHQKDNYRWWIARMQQLLNAFDIVRIDHFRGFEAYWEIPAEAKTAVDGKWKKGAGADFFNALFAALKKHQTPFGAPQIIAEDLGIITPEVTALRQKFGLPGMRILQFGLDGASDNWYLPHNFEINTVVYTGTHDNDTTCGWWNALAAHEQDYIRRYLGTNGEAPNWDLIRAALMSVAALAITPLQDVLGLDSAHRMNQPSMAEGAWEWRFEWSQVAPWHAQQLAELTRLYARDPAAQKKYVPNLA